MKIVIKLFSATLLMFLFVSTSVNAQVPTDVAEEPTEVTDPDMDRPLDDIVEKRIIDDRMVLKYQLERK